MYILPNYLSHIIDLFVQMIDFFVHVIHSLVQKYKSKVNSLLSLKILVSPFQINLSSSVFNSIFGRI